VPDVRYARAEDGTHVAYRVLEADPGREPGHDIIMVSGGLIPVELFDQEPGFVRMLDGLCSLGRVFVFDRRGLGLSDPIVDWDRPILDQWADDLAAVVEASGAQNPVVVSWESYGVAPRFAGRYPERVGHLVLYEPLIVADDEWEDFLAGRRRQIEANMSGEADILEQMAPSRMSDPTFREWYGRAGRAGASPATAQRIWESMFRSCPSDQLLDRIDTRTLVLHRRDNQYAPPGVVRLAPEQIRNSTVVELEGRDHFAFVGDVDALVAEIGQFLVGERRLPPPQRLLAAVMFTDLVGSTERAASVGDAQWKAMLDRHDRAVRAAVERCGGTVVKTTGDGVLAHFPSAGVAIGTADRIRMALAGDDLAVRVGIHVGDIDRRGADVSGLAVNIAARVMARAGDGEVVVTASVVAAIAGEAVAFEPMGPHELKGVPGVWDLFRLVRNG
jgi:class 3 adenylate cyclase